MTNGEPNERVCSNCGEGCSEQDVAIDGWCARCDEARADELMAQAEELEAAMQEAA